jgi:hypothetical protein
MSKVRDFSIPRAASIQRCKGLAIGAWRCRSAWCTVYMSLLQSTTPSNCDQLSLAQLEERKTVTVQRAIVILRPAVRCKYHSIPLSSTNTNSVPAREGRLQIIDSFFFCLFAIPLTSMFRFRPLYACSKEGDLAEIPAKQNSNYMRRHNLPIPSMLVLSLINWEKPFLL